MRLRNDVLAVTCILAGAAVGVGTTLLWAQRGDAAATADADAACAVEAAEAPTVVVLRGSERHTVHVRPHVRVHPSCVESGTVHIQLRDDLAGLERSLEVLSSDAVRFRVRALEESAERARDDAARVRARAERLRDAERQLRERVRDVETRLRENKNRI